MAIDGVSILIVCYGRLQLLRELFESIEEADKTVPYEVIVVDNSEPEDAKAIESMCNEFGFSYIYQLASVAVKRNTAAKAAKYNLLLYFDSDCKIDKNAITSHCDSYVDERIGAASGPIILDGGKTWLYRHILGSPWLDSFTSPLKNDYLPWGPTANFSIKKDVFEAIGGFDETFPNKPGGEDVDIGKRITGSGYLIASARNGVVHHSNKTWDNLADMNRRLYNYGKADGKLTEKYPDHSCPKYPFIPVRILLSIISVVLAALYDPLFLVYTPLALFLFPLLSTAMETMVRFSRLPNMSDFVVGYFSDIQELGCFVWCLENRKMKPLHLQFQYSPYQNRSISEINSCRSALLNITVISMIILIMI